MHERAHAVFSRRPRTISRTFVSVAPKLVAHGAWQNGTPLHGGETTVQNARKSPGSRSPRRPRRMGTAFASPLSVGVSVRDRPWDLRRTLYDMSLSVCALTVLLATLVAFDPRVREQVWLTKSGIHASAEMAAAGIQAHGLGTTLVSAAKYQSRQHAPLMIFVFVASVLTLFMLRT